LFFVSVGMLFDPVSLVREPWPLLATLFIIIVGKSVVAFLIVLAFRHPLGTALTISASLAQIGKFSFILAELGVKLNLLPTAGRDLILAGAILSIMLNPVVFGSVDWLTPRLKRPLSRVVDAPASDALIGRAAAPAESSELPDTTRLTGHTILVGYGRVGGIIADALKQNSQPLLVIEDAAGALAKLRESNFETIIGNAARSDVLKAANLAAARYLLIATPEAFEAGQIVQQARAANPSIQIIARAHSDAEVAHLTSLGADIVIMGEREIALGIIHNLFAWQARSALAQS
jgi:monovalent cation:H+ antiporter-2, CPA2 family